MNKYRQNILCWYPFKEGRILEIYSEESCFDNDVLIDSYNYRQIEQINNKYNYIVLNGVLDQNTDLLNITKQSLEKNGHIIVIADNKLGMKYFSGAYQEKTGKSFDGLNEKTPMLSKNEIISLVNECNLKNYKFYYPYPDYRTAFEVLTDTSINKINPSSINNPVDRDRYSLFEERKVNKELMLNKVAQYFANSYLVDISDENVDNNIDYIKISNNRKDEFKIYTQLDYTNRKVYKKPLNDNSKKHLMEIANNSFKFGLFENLKYEYIDDVLVCDLLEAKSLAKTTSIKNIWNVLNSIKKNLYINNKTTQEPNNQFIIVFGNEKTVQELHWLDNSNIDLLLDNIFEIEDKWIVIDSEWCFNFPVPAEFILFRTIINACTSDISISRQEVLDFIEIDSKTFETFVKWDNHFLCEYVGTSYKDYKKVIPTNIEEIEELRNENASLLLSAKELEAIKNSKVWKASKPLRKAIDKIKGNN